MRAASQADGIHPFNVEKACVVVLAWGLLGTAALGETPGEPSLIPRPARIQMNSGEFRSSNTVVLFEGGTEVRVVGEHLCAGLEALKLQRPACRPFEGSALPAGAILLSTQNPPGNAGEEGYDLRITSEHVVLRAAQPGGLFRGVQTLLQLSAPPDSGGLRWPAMHLSDQPRYRWRGMLLDCCRHFMSVDYVKRIIDLLAYHKMNVLHWHLTEDQGWRIEIKKYPRLTEVGAWRMEDGERYGGYYTQEQIRDIVAYAGQRHITVVPEIEMPGHALAALAAYPELSCTGGPFAVGTRWGVYDDVYCAGREETFTFLEDVLSEVLELFPSEHIHIGGDECPKVRWKNCRRCRERIRSEGLKDEHELQSYFVRRIERFLNARGRRLIGWDEILEGGLAPNATVQSWRGLQGAVAAARQGHDVICSPTSHCYFDYPQLPRPDAPDWMGVIPLQKVYSFEPTPAELSPAEARHVLGAEGNVWTERAPQPLVEQRVFPRLCALAEVTWSPAGRRDWDDFQQRMRTHYRRLDRMGVTYFIHPPEINDLGESAAGRRIAMKNPLGIGSMHYTTDGTEPSPSSTRYDQPITVEPGTQVKARLFLQNGRASDVAVVGAAVED